jgi:hypothetical protein
MLYFMYDKLQVSYKLDVIMKYWTTWSCGDTRGCMLVLLEHAGMIKETV